MNETCSICTKNVKGIQNIRKTEGETRGWEDNTGLFKMIVRVLTTCHT